MNRAGGIEDTVWVESERERYIDAHLNTDHLFSPTPCLFDFQDGLLVLEGALAIGRQADLLGMDEVAGRMDAMRASAKSAKKRSGSLPAKVKGWLGLSKALESAD